MSQFNGKLKTKKFAEPTKSSQEVEAHPETVERAFSPHPATLLASKKLAGAQRHDLVQRFAERYGNQRVRQVISLLNSQANPASQIKLQRAERTVERGLVQRADNKFNLQEIAVKVNQAVQKSNFYGETTSAIELLRDLSLSDKVTVLRKVRNFNKESLQKIDEAVKEANKDDEAQIMTAIHTVQAGGSEWIAEKTQIVMDAIKQGNFEQPGGAFWLLNGLKMADILKTLEILDSAQVAKLDQNINKAASFGAESEQRLKLVMQIVTEGWIDPASIPQDFPPDQLKELKKYIAKVILDFVPDEQMGDDGEPMGLIHVLIKGKDVAQFQARGGPPTLGSDPNATGTPDKRNPGHTIDPTKPGTHTLLPGTPFVIASWKFSQLAWGTPLFDEDTEKDPAKRGVLYKKKEMRFKFNTARLARPIYREEILDAEAANGRERKIPDTWDLNDFGPTAFAITGTPDLIHTTPTTEDQFHAGMEEKLTFSHGCIHIKPSDRVTMMERGFLRGGTSLKVRKYRPSTEWGKPP